MSADPNNDTGQGVGDANTFEVAVGDVASPDGRTSLRVEREGRFVVAHEWIDEQRPDDSKSTQQGDDGGDRRREEYEGNVGELGIEPSTLFEQVEALPQDRAFPNRPGLPDEPILTLEIDSPSGRRLQRMWLRDAEQEAAALFDDLRTIVERATDGRRYL